MSRGGHRRPGPRTLAPLLSDRIVTALRGGGWSRTITIRRLLAGLLVLLAVALALRPAPGTVTVLVAAGDLVPGRTLQHGDLATARLPAGAVPAGTLTNPGAAVGRILASAARAGEPITDVRLAGAELTALHAPDSAAATVPVRLADPDVADLLYPGSEVDVVGIGERNAEPAVLAERATVVTVLDQDEPGIAAAGQSPGRLVVVVLPRPAATRVAAASLAHPLTVTLR